MTTAAPSQSTPAVVAVEMMTAIVQDEYGSAP
jgi:hypothetical protein